MIYLAKMFIIFSECSAESMQGYDNILTKYRKGYFTNYFFKLNYNNYIISLLIKFVIFFIFKFFFLNQYILLHFH
jgi:hypothetical protein